MRVETNISGDFIKPLPQEIKKNGFTYVLVRKGLKAAVFEQRFKNQIIGYEVFIIKIRHERIFKNQIRHAREKFPDNEAFGRWAWSCLTLNEAIGVLNRIEYSNLNYTLK